MEPNQDLPKTNETNNETAGNGENQPLSGIDADWWNSLSSSNQEKNEDPIKEEEPESKNPFTASNEEPTAEDSKEEPKAESNPSIGNENSYYKPWTKPELENGKEGAEPGAVKVNLPPPPLEDKYGKNAKVLSIIALAVGFVCCQLAGLIIGIIALTKVKASQRELGFLSPEASAARTIAIIAIVLSVLGTILSIVSVVFSAMLQMFV